MDDTQMTKARLHAQKASSYKSYIDTQLDSAIEVIRAGVWAAASETPDTKYYYEIRSSTVIQHLDTLLKKLAYYFPDSSITHSLLSRGTDGNLYDISKLTDDTLKLVSKAEEASYIVIDWT